MPPVPHATWAEVYDMAYEETFGALYAHFTQRTLEVMRQHVPPPATLVDFGAGTGRLAIPLAEQGYEVTAVDPCWEMLCQLKQNARAGGARQEINAVCSTMQDFQGNEQFDFALCVFTVLNYLLDEDTLSRAIQSLYRSLRQGHLCLIDISGNALFHGYNVTTDNIIRSVEVTCMDGDIYNYRESITVRENNTRYEDEFRIRFWPAQQVLDMAAREGFAMHADLTHEFIQYGASYYLLEKT